MKSRFSLLVVTPGLRLSALVVAGTWLLVSSPARGQEIGRRPRGRRPRAATAASLPATLATWASEKTPT